MEFPGRIDVTSRVLRGAPASTFFHLFCFFLFYWGDGLRQKGRTARSLIWFNNLPMRSLLTFYVHFYIKMWDWDNYNFLSQNVKLFFHLVKRLARLFAITFLKSFFVYLSILYLIFGAIIGEICKP